MALVVVSPRELRRGHCVLLGGVAIIVAGYALVLHEQLSSRPFVAAYNPIWSDAARLLGRSLSPSVSVVRDEPFYALGAPLAAVLVLILGIVVGADHVRARQAIAVAAWAGAIYAIYGIFALFLTPNLILWREKTAYLGDLTATFINRNTAAAYFGTCAVLWLVLLMEVVRGRVPRGPIVWRQALAEVLSHPPRRLMIRFVMMFICLGAMFLTSSRAGSLCTLLSLVVAFVLYFRRDLPRGRGLLVAIAAAVTAAFLLLEVIGANIGARIDQLGLADLGRLSVYRSTLRMIEQSPWFGTGLGTFPWAFPAYRSADISMAGVWGMAHSTPLELAAEVGIPLAVLVGLGWVTAFIVLLRGAARRRHYAIMPIAALSSALLALLHSTIDFPLQIVGYAIVVFGVVGVGLGQSFAAPEAEGQPTRIDRSSRGRTEEHLAKNG
jgi:O-antigen ligase